MVDRRTVHCKLVSWREGQYTQFVFKNLEPTNEFDQYIMVTRCPNWDDPNEYYKNITGYLTYEPVEAGNTYYNSTFGEHSIYRYTACYFINFIKETTETKVKNFNF